MTLYKIVYLQENNELTSFPQTNGCAIKYVPDVELESPFGPFMCWSCLELAQRFHEQINPRVRYNYKLWEIEATVEDDLIQVDRGIKLEYLNPENVKAYWQKMRQMTAPERETYWKEKQRGLFRFEYGTVLCRTVKLVKVK